MGDITLSILFESYCNEVKVGSMSQENMTFNSLRVLLQHGSGTR
ncbi:hypothetical protein BD01_0521 [Thermococcus nautili]|uniref:Uncharacterized protein n=1 Tax=Thermococcus nautili TaxID=195522 RepID=W8P096_9EURY|nr:hypothetical protein BD01_0521 [Thermococcus nautili]